MHKNRPPHIEMSDECYQELFIYYSQLPNCISKFDLNGKQFGLRWLGLTEDEIAQVCKEKEISEEETTRAVMELQEMSLRELARSERKRKREEKGLVIGVGAKRLFKDLNAYQVPDPSPDVIYLRNMAEKHKAHVLAQKNQPNSEAINLL